MKSVLKNPVNPLIMLITVLTMALTFSCSSEEDSGTPIGNASSSSNDNSGGGSSSSGGFDERVPSQAYNNEDGTKFEASGILKFKLCKNYKYIEEETHESDCNDITTGSVTNGVVNMQQPLPLTIEDKYLFDVTELFDDDNCLISQKDAKISEPIEFFLDNDVSYIYLAIAYIDYSSQVMQGYYHLYSSKATKVTCSKINLDIKAGWNKLYFVKNHSGEEFSTDNILTGDVRWTLSGKVVEKLL
jgi:hypothetical protein